MATFEFTTKTKSSVCSINNGFFFTFSHKLYSLSVVALDDTILRAMSTTQVEHNFNIDVDTDIIIIDSVTFEGATAQQLYDSLETLFFLDETVNWWAIKGDVTLNSALTNYINYNQVHELNNVFSITINHGLDRLVQVLLLDEDNKEFEANITHVDSNTVMINGAPPMTGVAYII